MLVKSSPLLWVCVAFSGLAAAVVEVDDLLRHLEADLADRKAETNRRTVLLKHRSTKYSKAMERRNQLHKKGRDFLLQRDDSLSPDQVREHVDRALDMADLNDADRCVVDLCGTGPTIDCSTAQTEFRTIDGNCNNLMPSQGRWGAINTRASRFIAPLYADGRRVPRGGYPSAGDECPRINTCSTACNTVPGNLLPNPRHVSSTLHRDMDRPDADHTNMLTQFGQLLDHDLVLTPEAAELEPCRCSDHPTEDCFSFEVPCDDPFHLTGGCMELSRSVAFCDDPNAVREQFNVVTAFVDASSVYGSTLEVEASLRETGNSALLKVSELGLLPVDPVTDHELAGDERAREMPGLATAHTIFVLEHNRIVRQMDAMPQSEFLEKERIYQLARRLVGAMTQRIVYAEYLPVILGENSMQKYDLSITNGRTRYHTDVDPGIRNSFATAAFRFGHTQIQGLVQMINLQTAVVSETFLLRDNFNNMAKFRQGNGTGMLEILLGLLEQPAQAYDQFITEDVTNFLFTNPESIEDRMDDGAQSRAEMMAMLIASDLAARNIQRGRDHGLPGYNAFRELCGLPKACSWQSPPAEIEPILWSQLSRLYTDPDDIDLFPAGILESPFDGGVVGATFNCIIGRQFQALKQGDRFFFTHDGVDNPHPWTNSQIEYVMNYGSFADIICRISQGAITEIRENVFVKSSPVFPCCTQSDQSNCKGGAPDLASFF